MKYVISQGLESFGAGSARKIIEQVAAFRASGLKCEIFVLPFYGASNRFLGKCLRRLPFVNLHKHWRVSDLVNEDYLYIRRLGEWDASSIRFFERLKANNSHLKIVYEIPTYPYDDEVKISLTEWPLLLKDKWNRCNIHHIVDRIATLTADDEIFGVPTLKIGNGLDVDKLRPRKPCENADVHAIAVSNCELWHGYDRFIEGLRAYYAARPKRKFFFHIVGQGKEYTRYQKMVQDYGLSEYVIMYGKQTGEALDNIYDQCNLAIASLGGYRRGLDETKELKTREYVAKGLPFISSVVISDISQSDKDNIYLQVSNNDLPIDIQEVLSFYDRIYTEHVECVNQRLRHFAKEHFSMEVAMKEVISYFKEDDKAVYR